MRLSIAAAALLQPLLLAVVTAQNDNEAVVYPEPVSILMGDSIVNVAFYEKEATMPGEGGQGQNLCPENATGRTFHAEVTGDDDDDCDGDCTCYEMTFFFESESRHSKVVSCPGGKSILDVTSSPSSLSDGTSSLTTEERTFLCGVAASVEKSHEDVAEIVSSHVHSLESQLARAARLLCSWPDELGVSYSYDEATAGGGGGDGIGSMPTLIPGNDPSVPPDDDLGDTKRTRARRGLQVEKQPRAVVTSLRGGQSEQGGADDQGGRETRISATSLDKPGIYPLCDDIGSWIQSSDGASYAQIGSDRPCENEGMRIHDGSCWTCIEPMYDASPPRYGPAPDWSSGFCFGQCGGGGCATNGLAHYMPFTSDCADYDYCDRFGIGGDDGYDCHQLFLNAVDDWMWGANCDAPKDDSDRCYAIPPPPIMTTTTAITSTSPIDDEAGTADEPLVERSSLFWYGPPISSSPKDLIPYEILGLDGSVAGGFDDCNNLENGIREAAKYLVNEAIKWNAEYDPYEYYYGAVEEEYVDFNESAAFDVELNPMHLDPSSAPINLSPDAGKASGLEDSYQTNTQEEEVGEADLIKSDGKVIVAAYGDEIFVVDAVTLDVRSQAKYSYDDTDVMSSSAIDPSTATRYSSAEVAALLNSEPALISIDPIWYYPIDMPPRIVALLLLESSNRLVVILQAYPKTADYNDVNRPILSANVETHVRLYDMSDPSNPTPVGIKVIKGSYIAARAVGNIVHLVTSSWIDTSFHLQTYFVRYRDEYAGLNRTDYIAAAQAKSDDVIDSFVARLSDEIIADESGSCEDIMRISSFRTMDAAGGSSSDDASNSTATGDSSATLGPEDLLSSFVRISSLDATQGPPSANESLSTAQAGVFVPGQESWVYASQDVLVVPAWGGGYDVITGKWEINTLLFVFALQSDGSAAQGIGVAKVRGTTTMQGSLNQFALDEYQGLLRVATTNLEEWGCLEDIDPDLGWCQRWGIISSTSQVTVLRLPDTSTSGQVIEQVSVIENLGVTEQIYAVRFMDDKAFVVTFRRTDPFYTIDFSDPTNPNPPIGELANITGFSNYLHPYDPAGNIILAVGEDADLDGRALGLQISLFDVTDLTNPTLMHKYFEGTGASSDAQWDHKAFRFVRRSNFADGGGGVLILPVSQYTYQAEGNTDGFKLYDVSAENGIQYLFDVSHATSEQIAYWCWSSGSELPSRSFLIGGDLITTKKRSIVKTDLDTETLEWKLDMESNVGTNCYYYY